MRNSIPFSLKYRDLQGFLLSMIRLRMGLRLVIKKKIMHITILYIVITMKPFNSLLINALTEDCL